MIKKFLILSLLGMCIVKNAFAFSFLNPISTEAIKPNNAFTHKEVPHDVTDFSGVWKGKCVFTHYETEETIVIKSNDKYIEFGNHQFLIGSLHSESNASPNVTYFDHKQLEWSDDRKSLNLQGTKVLSNGSEKPLSTYLFSNKISLVDDQIVIIIKVKGFQNMDVIAEDTGNCMLSRI